MPAIIFNHYLLFFSVFIPFAVILYARLVVPHKLSRKWRITFGTVIILLIGVMSWAFPVSLRLSKEPSLYEQYNASAWLPWLYYILSFICLLLLAILIRDIIWIIVRCIRFYKSHNKKTTPQDKTAPEQDADTENALLSRREFLKRTSTFAVIGGAVLATPAAIYHAKQGRIVKEINISLEAIPAEIDGFRIVHLSDIHVGNTIFEEDIAQIVAQTNALNPDLIAITGDMADGLPEHIGDWINPMKDFKSKYGSWFVTGNHDHMWDAKGWCERIAKLGIHVLDNEHKTLEVNGITIAIAGAIDEWGDRRNRKWRSDPEKALSGIAPEMFKLMLVHRPSSVNKSLAAGAHVILAGHTHGGQCWPLTYIIDTLHHYSRGLYEVDGRAVFVSCGTGYWGPPLRIGVPPEIDVITLHHK